MQSINHILYEKPFFDISQPQHIGDLNCYLGKTYSELCGTTKLLEVSCQINPPILPKKENRIWVFIKKIFKAIGKWFHELAGRLVIPASFMKKEAEKYRVLAAGNASNFFYDKETCAVKRLKIKIDKDLTIDAYLIGKPSNLQNRRWTLISCGNGMLAEYALSDSRNPTQSLINKFDSNALVFNYPGVGESNGKSNREALVKAYSLMLKVLEEEVQAKEIIAYGLSLGGGVQAEACEKHTFKSHIKYVLIKDRTFSIISKVATFITKLFGWNMSAISSTKQPEIILQRTNGKPLKELTHANQVIGDGVISKKGALATHILTKGKRDNQTVIGINEGHNVALRLETQDFLAEKVKSLLDRSN